MLERLLQRTTPLLTLIAQNQVHLVTDEQSFEQCDKTKHAMKSKQASKFSARSVPAHREVGICEQNESFFLLGAAPATPLDNSSSAEHFLVEYLRERANIVFHVLRSHSPSLEPGRDSTTQLQNLLNSIGSGSRRKNRFHGFKLLRIGRQASGRPQITKTIDLDKNVRELIYKRISECVNECAIPNSAIQNHAMAMPLDTTYGLKFAFTDLSAHTILQVWQAWTDRSNQQLKSWQWSLIPKQSKIPSRTILRLRSIPGEECALSGVKRSIR